MPSYHCSIKVISRSTGRTSVAAAAYRAGEKLVNEHDLTKEQVTHDYSKRKDVLHAEIILPENANQEFYDRSVLWNAVEAAEGNNISAQVSREFELALPKELSLENNINLVRGYITENYISKGIIADFAIHEGHADKSGNSNNNIHAHVMLTMRPLDEHGNFMQHNKSRGVYLDKDGKALDPTDIENRVPIIDKKTGKQKLDSRNRKQWVRGKQIATGWDFEKNEPIYTSFSKEELKENTIALRKDWADRQNKALEENGIDERVDHRSHADRQADGVMIVGIKPTIDIGREAFQLERKGIMTEQGELNRQIKADNKSLLMRVKDSLVSRIKSFLGKPLPLQELDSKPKKTIIQPLESQERQSGAKTPPEPPKAEISHSSPSESQLATMQGLVKAQKEKAEVQQPIEPIDIRLTHLDRERVRGAENDYAIRHNDLFVKLGWKLVGSQLQVFPKEHTEQRFNVSNDVMEFIADYPPKYELMGRFKSVIFLNSADIAKEQQAPPPKTADLERYAAPESPKVPEKTVNQEIIKKLIALQNKMCTYESQYSKRDKRKFMLVYYNELPKEHRHTADRILDDRFKSIQFNGSWGKHFTEIRAKFLNDMKENPELTFSKLSKGRGAR